MSNIAIVPGTFDPITFGHIDIVNKACKMFDVVIMAVAKDNYKTNLFTLNERVNMCKEVFKNNSKVQVEGFEGLVVDFAKSKNSKVMIRGMRAVSDFEYELQINMVNKKLNNDIETLYFVPNFEYLYLSSSMVRNMVKVGGDIDSLVPANVINALKDKIINKQI